MNRMNEKNNHKRWWHLSVDQVAKDLKTDIEQGLSNDKVQERLKQYGLNQLPEQKRISLLFIFLSQFSSFIIWILIGALIITAFLGQWIDALAIGTIVIFNAAIGFFQEYKAERSLAALRKLTKPTSRVIRDGIMQAIASHAIVPGDVVILESGDRVPADGRVMYVAQLTTQEAALTGESVSIVKHTEELPDKQLPIGDRKNMVFMGTIVVSGKGHMIVTATALQTELGAIAFLLQTTEEEKTPLQIKLAQLGRQLVMLCFGIIGVVFILGIWHKIDVLTMILTSLSLAVAAIPEGLPAVMTIALAIGVRKMAQRQAIIRRLASVETLGCITVICSDKTGTLTQNEMAVTSIWLNKEFITVTGIGYGPEGQFKRNDAVINPHDNAELIMALKISVLCNNAEIHEIDGKWQSIGDPTEGALLAAAAKAGLYKKDLEDKNHLIGEIPFASERKRMSVIRDSSAGHILYIKGAAGIIAARSTNILINGNQVALTQEYKKQIEEANNYLARQALRVLAVAYRDTSTHEFIDESTEKNLTFVGLIGMIDPPRPEVKMAIETCKKAGIKTVMITGDHRETAIAIAKDLHVMDADLIAVTGEELDQMDDDEFKNNVRRIAVYARVSAQHKIRIIRAWRALGEIVAMTGDGVNDAPAIKAADIGIAMGITGTEVTKEASDMVIADDNFASIVHAVEEGRGIYDNILKFVNYLLSSNIAELLVIFMGTFLGFVDPQGNPYIPLLPVQLLWINLVTDGFPAIALAVDPIDPNIMSRAPRNPSAPILSWYFTVQLFLISFVIALGALAACHFGLSTSARLGHTMTFTTLIVLEFVRIAIVRGQYHVGIFSNWWLIIALIGSFVLQLGVIYMPSLQKIFRTTPLGITEWIVIGVIALFAWLSSLLIQFILKFIQK